VATWRLVLEYDGAPFAGWQRQPGQLTVQGELERALSTILREPVGVTGAGRTDAGVHALGQVASFSTTAVITSERLRRGVTALVRPHVAVRAVRPAADAFNARFDARGKRYRYRLLVRDAPSPLNAATSWHLPWRLDRAAMDAAGRALLGTHDFAAFRAADCERRSTIRTLGRVDLVDGPEGIVDLVVEGDGFLKNMVRILAGTLVAVGQGRIDAARLDRALTTGDRRLTGQTAPPHGLTLVEVFYPPDV